MQTLAVDPLDARVVYAGTTAAGLFKSSDGGQHWARLDGPGLGTSSILAVAVDRERRSNAVYVGTATALVKSDDAGVTWRVLDGLPVGSWSAFALAASAPGLVYAAVELPAPDGEDAPREAIFRSTDGGATWHADLTLGALQAVTEPIPTLLIGPLHPWQAYAGVAPLGVLRKPRPRLPWQSASHGMRAQNGLTLSPDPHARGTLYASLDITRVDGAGLPQTQSAGIAKSTNGGVTWTTVNRGLTAGQRDLAFVTRIVADPVHLGTLYACSLTGVYRTADGGASWNLVLPGFTPLDIAFDPPIPGTCSSWARWSGSRLPRSSHSSRSTGRSRAATEVLPGRASFLAYRSIPRPCPSSTECSTILRTRQARRSVHAVDRLAPEAPPR